MAQRDLAGKTIEVDNEGYMTDIKQWTKEIAAALAREQGIDVLTDRHWQVIDYLRGKYEEGVSLSLRKVGKSGIVDIKEFYSLFPDGPLKKATLIGGLPKPESCV
jgi:TusE/DsrC/DsvC family sulfur relay protein